MLRFMTRRGLWASPVLIVGSFLMFAALHMTTDPVAAARHNNVTPDALIRFKHDLGVDRPLLVQYWTAVSNFFRGNWGTSFTSQGPVWPQLRTALANTLVLGIVAGVFYVTIGVIF